MLRKPFVLGAAMVLTLGVASSAWADLIQDPNITVQGSGLGAVNTIVTVHDSGGGSPNTNGTEGGCITQSGSTTATCADPTVTEHDNTAINQVLTVSNTGSFATVVNMSETGNDINSTLTALFLTFCGVNGCHTASYTGADLVLTTAGANGGTGGSGFIFKLDTTEAALVATLGPTLTVSGGLQFANGTTNDGNETMYLINVSGQPATLVPEPASLTLFGLGLSSLGALVRRRKNSKANS